MTFQAPYSSSPPLTPNKLRNNGKQEAFSYGTDPSTTPAGPPPSSSGSFTPQGLPPSSFLGSSNVGIQNPFSFSKGSPFDIESSPTPSFTPSQTVAQDPVMHHAYPKTTKGFFVAPDYGDQVENGSVYMGREVDEEDEEDDDNKHEEVHRRFQSINSSQEAEYEEDEADQNDENMADYQSSSADSERGMRPRDRRLDTDDEFTMEGSLVQSRDADPNVYKSTIQPTARTPSLFEQIAKDLYTRMPIPSVDESEDLVLKTERIIVKLYDHRMEDTEDEVMFQEALSAVPFDLTNLWETYHKKTTIQGSREYYASIGPGCKATNYAKANFLAGITLRVYHPRITTNLTSMTRSLPETLLEWLERYHNPYPDQLKEIMSNRPTPANHKYFWDGIFNSLIRGEVSSVVQLLQNAGWRHAHTESDHSQGLPSQVGFSGLALRNVEQVVNAATQVLVQCPAMQRNWNIRSNEWNIFRLRALEALEGLKGFAEGRERRREKFHTAESGSYSQAARQAESQVPWHIYQNLLALYSLVLGEKDAIIENSQDWCEATIGLLVWWDEGKHDSRLSLRRSFLLDDSRSENFEQKLRKAFNLAIDESTDFKVNTADEIELSLASLFEGDSEAVIAFLRGWSLPLSSAVAEVASLAGWLPPPKEKNLIAMDGLDEEDMGVLGLGASPSKMDGVKDRTLVIYAQGLINRQSKESSTRRRSGEDYWELAISILGRLDSLELSDAKIGELLTQLPLDQSDTVDRLWKALNSIGMNHHAGHVAESFANSLANSSHKYGTALWYYALAYKKEKVKDVLDLLISTSLVQSIAYPPEAELDEHLKLLISSPGTQLMELSRCDIQAAQLLQNMLSGYATLRHFYDLRDEQFLPSAKERLFPSAGLRKSNAAEALIAVISSSDDNIRGGLYDEGRGAIVSVDFLLALLGEALIFVNQSDFDISVSQIEILLKAVEDLQSVGSMVYSACTNFLDVVIASAQGLEGSTPIELLRRSTSNVSGSSFSMVGSSMLASQLKQSIGNSGVLVKGNTKRGWDWRRNIAAGCTGDEILRLLRYGLAKDLAKAWLLEADGRV